MRTFSIRGANHYCGSFKPNPGIAEQPPQEFWQQRLQGRSSLKEGTHLFDEYRACALRDAERSLFLAASHYRRALDMMIPSSSYWAHVTLYYGAFFAARALLGMFGCGVFNNHVIYVSRSSPGSQELRVQRIGSKQGWYFVKEKGSHRRFWEIFYSTVTSVKRLVDVEFATALAPISSNNSWLIEQRNNINYKTTDSMNLVQSFEKSFNSQRFSNSLPGALQTQYSVSEGILAASCSFARQFRLETDALDFLGSSLPFAQIVSDHIYDPALPDLVDMTKRKKVFGI